MNKKYKEDIEKNYKSISNIVDKLTCDNIHYLHTGSCTKECKQIKKDILFLIQKDK